MSVHVSVPYVIAGSTHELYMMYLFKHVPIFEDCEDAAVLGECCPPGRDSSLNLLVLIFVSDGWCCISVPGRCNFQGSRSGCC